MDIERLRIILLTGAGALASMLPRSAHVEAETAAVILDAIRADQGLIR